MNKFSKTLLIIFSLLFMTVCVFAVSVTWPWAQNSEIWGSIRYFFTTNYYAYSAIFWIAIACLVAFIVGILVILFYPKATTTFTLKDDRGKLSVHSRAIEGIVRSMLNEDDFIRAPRIKVQTLNHRIKVNVKGSIKRTSALVDHADEWSASVEDRIKNLVGPHHSVKVYVRLERYQPRNTPASNKVRVE